MTLRGVVVTVIITIWSIAMFAFAYDYRAVRVAAARGQAAYEFLDNAIKAQQKQAVAAPTPPPEEKKQ